MTEYIFNHTPKRGVFGDEVFGNYELEPSQIGAFTKDYSIAEYSASQIGFSRNDNEIPEDPSLCAEIILCSEAYGRKFKQPRLVSRRVLNTLATYLALQEYYQSQGAQCFNFTANYLPRHIEIDLYNALIASRLTDENNYRAMRKHEQLGACIGLFVGNQDSATGGGQFTHSCILASTDKGKDRLYASKWGATWPPSLHTLDVAKEFYGCHGARDKVLENPSRILTMPASIEEMDTSFASRERSLVFS
jgi:hypothetical protein